ncbi:MAG: hypothetical protein D6734_05965 [Candidatus Schekmanbacteria bacterium]|nr:MAG: hypothetical protein D6734_05965 [Candidatus Schekmanbacteria bacterium]
MSKEASEIEISLSAEKESVFRKYFGQKMTSLMEEDANSHNSEKSPEMKRIEILRHDFMRDLFFEEISTKFMKTESDFKAVYFLGPDGIEHAFWKYYEPHYFDDVSDKDVEIFGKIIENYYIFLDEAVGNLYSSIDDDTVTIIISDHGMGPWRRSLFDKLLMKVIKRYERSSGNHRRNGIIIISGKNIKKSAEIKNATIFDIAPTVLHLLGFPVAKDMKGRVLTEVIDDDWLSKFPISYIKSYEGVVKKEIIPELKASDKKDLERLKALGYIK